MLIALDLSGLALVQCGSSSGAGGSSVTGGIDASDRSLRDASNGDASDATMTDSPADAPSEAALVPCDAADACSGSLACCSGFCTSLRHDPRNCGSCGNACTATQFCTGTHCDDVAFSNVTANTSITVVEDPYAVDIEAGVAIGSALATASDGGLAVVPQTKSGVLIPEGDAGWRPNTGGSTTLVAGGSWWGQLSVAYMDNTGLTPVYLTNDGTTSRIYQRATGLALVTVADSMLTSSHDYFILELAVEPRSGTLCLFGEGILGAGTVAAGYWGSHVVVPNHASYTAPWYVYEWTDTNGDTTPDQGDTFSLVAQGQ